MAFFDPANRSRSKRHRELYAAYEIAYKSVDFLASQCFIAGSVLFFWDSTMTIATWLFLVGSIFFAMRPTAHVARELHYWLIREHG